jgi:hypothetical protein
MEMGDECNDVCIKHMTRLWAEDFKGLVDRHCVVRSLEDEA